jgi:pSer/pThr/pTyr-binding forkhead associated (FHA) protein
MKVLEKDAAKSRVAPPTPWGKPPPSAARKKHLLVRIGATPLELEPGKVVTIGRNADCTLPVPSTRVSRVHAEIRWKDGRPVIADKGSANGTFVGGKPIAGDHSLAPGDEIEIGPFLCVYRLEDPAKLAIPETVIGGRTMVDAGDLLGGQIGENGIAEVLQQIEFNKKTGTLIVFSSKGQGWATFEDGLPRAAEAGKSRDAEAAFFLLGLRAGRFSFTSELRTTERRMKGTITGLLLEWGRRADEGER